MVELPPELGAELVAMMGLLGVDFAAGSTKDRQEGMDMEPGERHGGASC